MYLFFWESCAVCPVIMIGEIDINYRTSQMSTSSPPSFSFYTNSLDLGMIYIC